jgi:hypothetical protein
MSEIVKETNRTAVDLDGFAGYTREIEGEEEFSGIANLVKYKAPQWMLNSVALPPDGEYIVKGIGRFVIKWHRDKSLAPTREPVPDGKKFPNLKELNAKTPQDEWVFDVDGKTLKGPYAPEHQVYLINRAMDELTYVTSTTGGSIAVDELAKKTRNLHAYYNDNSLRLMVKLSHTFMPTGYGGLERPHFVYVRAVRFGSGDAPVQLPNPVTTSLEQFAADDDVQTVKKPTAKEVTGDEIPF